MEEYLPILLAFQSSGVRYAAIGTWALLVHFPAKMRDYMLQDCDIVLAPDLRNLKAALGCLKENDWQATVWETNIPEDASESFFVGKYYVRGRKGSLTLDMTYECKLPWEEIDPGIELRMGAPLASVAHILDLKRRKMVEQGNEQAYFDFERKLF